MYAKRFEIWKNISWNWWVDCFIAWSIKRCDILGAHSESIFPFMQYFFSFQKTVFPLVSLSLAYGWVNQLRYFYNLIRVIDSLRDDDEFSWNNFFLLLWQNFYMAKNIRGFLGNLTDNFLNIIVNVSFFGNLKFEYYWALPWNTSTSNP